MPGTFRRSQARGRLLSLLPPLLPALMQPTLALLHPRPPCRQAHLRERVAGVIFDSAPCYMHGTVGAQALGEGRPLPLRALLAAVFLLVMALMLLTDPRAPQRFW